MATEVCSKDRAMGLGTTSSFETLPDTQPMHDFAEIVQGYKGDDATCLGSTTCWNGRPSAHARAFAG
jgi:hypothetical protein